jgi:hypothetical protein
MYVRPVIGIANPQKEVATRLLYAARAHTTSVSHGRASPRRLSRSASAKAAFPLAPPAQ